MDVKTVSAFQNGASVSRVNNQAGHEDNKHVPKELVLNATEFINHQTPDRVINGDIGDVSLNLKKLDGFQIEKKIAKAAEVTKGKMSILRKIAFGFSFLPSVMFVISFAVILPCAERPNEACLKEMWSVIVNNTKISTDSILVGDSFVVGFNDKDSGRIVKFSKNDGKEIWNSSISSPPSHMQCISKNHRCIMMDTTNQVYLLNLAEGNVSVVATNSFPLLLPSCDKDTSVTFATITFGEINIIKDGIMYESFPITGCTGAPKNIVFSIQDTYTTLAFVCDTSDSSNKGLFMLFEIEHLCPENRVNLIKLRKQSPLPKNDKVLLLPINDGIIAWIEQNVIYFHNSGNEKWSTTVDTESPLRFALYGSFNKGQKQVALFSENLQKDEWEMTILSAVDGKVVFQWLNTSIKIKRAVSISIEDRDFIFLVQDRIGNCSQKTIPIMQMNNMESQRCQSLVLLKFVGNTVSTQVLTKFEVSAKTKVDVQLKTILTDGAKSKKRLEVLKARTLINDQDGKLQESYAELKMFESKDFYKIFEDYSKCSD